MKKLFLTIMCIITIVVAGCGGSTTDKNSPENVKKEARTLYDKYYGQNSNTLAAFKNCFIEIHKYNDWSPEIITVGEKYEKELNSVVENINKEVVSSKNETLKSNLVIIAQSLSQIIKLGVDDIRTEGKNSDSIGESIKTVISNYKTANNSFLNDYSMATTGKPVNKISVDGKEYYASSLSNVDIAIMSIESKPSIGNDFLSATANGKYCIIKVAIKNNQKDAIKVDAGAFKLIDDQKREYSISSDALVTYRTITKNHRGFLTTLNPGLQTEIYLIFDIPKDMDKSQFFLQATGGATGKQGLIPLMSLATLFN